MKKALIFLFLLCLGPLSAQVQKQEAMTLPKEIVQKQFHFKGFSLIINDDVQNEQGNHLLVGEIRARESEAKNRDSALNVLFKLPGYSMSDPMGFIITTDNAYQQLQMVPSFVGQKIHYNKTKKLYTIGANHFDYLQVDGKSFSAWQPVIMQLDFMLQGSAYFVSKNYSFILKDMLVQNDEIILFTRSDKTKVGDKEGEKAEVMTVNVNKSHVDSLKYRDVLDVQSCVETPYDDIGRLCLSEISYADSAYYFTTSNLNQFTLKNANHLYQYKNKHLTEITTFPDYLKWNSEDSHWININDFYVSANKNYIFLAHQGASKKEISCVKTNSDFNILQSKKIPLNDYADFDRMFILSNGNIVILLASETKTWTYYLFNSDMQYINEVDATISHDYYPTRIIETGNNRIECLFYIDNVYKKDCLLQNIQLD